MVIVPSGSGPNSTLHVQIPMRSSASPQKFAVTIPQGVQPGGRFQANLGGILVWLHCPMNLGPGKQMLVDANSDADANAPAMRNWPPPIAIPEELDSMLLPHLSVVMHFNPPVKLRPLFMISNDPFCCFWCLAVKQTPEWFLCPITGCLMRQPAVTPDGVTYDYDAIVEWLQNKLTDPTTNQPLRLNQLYPNRTVRSMIEEYIAKGPGCFISS